MAENSKISWTDHTFSPWIGCAKISPGCQECYAAALAERYGWAKWGKLGTRTKTAPNYWRQPLKWEKLAVQTGVSPRVFPSLCDPFEDFDNWVHHHSKVPLLICDSCGAYHADDDAALSESCKCSRFKQRMDWAKLDDLRNSFFELIDATPHVTWLLLTKRPENVRRMWPEMMRERPTIVGGFGPSGKFEGYMRTHDYRPNVWLLTSVENQETVNQRVPELLKLRDLVPVLGVSAEPLLESVDFTKIPMDAGYQLDALTGHLRGTITRDIKQSPKLDWMIVGGESGKHARPFSDFWAWEQLVACEKPETPIFIKQLGDNCQTWGGDTWPNGSRLHCGQRMGDPYWAQFKARAGADPAEWPECLRVQQYPAVSPLWQTVMDARVKGAHQ